MNLQSLLNIIYKKFFTTSRCLCCCVVGEQCKFIVNTQSAGSGALAVTVDGPSKVQLNCREVEEGYEFTYAPSAPGDYLITIKYAGNSHVPGSPFKAKITGVYRA